MAEILLLGWQVARLPKGVARLSDLEPAEQVLARWLWDGRAGAIAELWREHRDWLLAEATRLGLPRLYAHPEGKCYYGEMVSRNLGGV